MLFLSKFKLARKISIYILVFFSAIFRNVSQNNLAQFSIVNFSKGLIKRRSRARNLRSSEKPVCSRPPSFRKQRFLWRLGCIKAQALCGLVSLSIFFDNKKRGTRPVLDSGRSFVFQNDTMQVVWQYHVEEPVSAAGVLPDHGAVRGSRPLYLVQRDTQPRRSSRNQDAEPPLKIWDILNKQVGKLFNLLSF